MGSSRKSSSRGWSRNRDGEATSSRDRWQQQTHLSGQLDTDGRALAVLDAERTDDGVGVRLETTHLQAFLDTADGDDDA